MCWNLSTVKCRRVPARWAAERDTGFNHFSVETLAEHFLRAEKALIAAGRRMDGKGQWMQAMLLESLAVKEVGFVFHFLTFYSFIVRLEKIAYVYERKVPIEAECRDQSWENNQPREPSSRAVFLNQGQSGSRGIWSCHFRFGGVVTSFSWVQARNPAQHPTMHRAAPPPQQRVIWPNGNSVKVERPPSKRRKKTYQEHKWQDSCCLMSFNTYSLNKQMN